MRIPLWVFAIVGLSLVLIGPAQADETPKAINSLYPELAFGVLSYAHPAELPEGVLARAGELTFSKADLAQALSAESDAVRKQFEKASFLAADYAFSRRLVLHLAKEDAAKDVQAAPQDDQQILGRFLGKLVESVAVSDQEITTFYNGNPDMFGGAPLRDVKDRVAQYLLADKRQTAINEYVQTMGQRMAIEVSAPWAKEQADAAHDNPLDKVKLNGLPTVATFSSETCPPCRMLAPILERLQKKYDGKVNVVTVMVEDNPLLGMKYGADATPTIIFFDKEGKGVGRHVGYLSQRDLEKKMTEAGIR